MKTMRLALLAFTLTLGACEKEPESAPPIETEKPIAETQHVGKLPQAPASSPATGSSAPEIPASDAVYVTYHCDNGKSVAANYDTSGEAPAATLIIDNKYYAMYSVVSASGARYASEQGLLPDEGMQWYVKDDEAMLVAMVLDHTANPDDAQVLFRCQLAQDL